MNCNKCNTEIPENFKFCPECGSNVSGISAESADMSLGDFKTQVTNNKLPITNNDDISLGDFQTLDSRKFADSATSGDVIANRYEVIEKIGEGGFGVVYTAKDKSLGGRIIAVKVLLSKFVTGEDTKNVVQRFMQEASSIASLNHRNIVTVYDCGSDDNTTYITMEYIEGGTLKDYLKEKGVPKFPEAMKLFKGIAQGLSYAHRKNIIHRDIKPANIMLQNEDGVITPKILDFGLARMGASSELSMTGYGMGTPAYMPPEQRRDAKNVNHTADIYALGKILYELVTGEIPDNVDQQLIPPPPELSNIIFKCLKSKPEERYFTVDDIIRELSAISGQLSAKNNQLPITNNQYTNNQCPVCNYENDKNIKFCEGCGNGLTRKCPECETETNIHIKFCKGCGTGIDDFKIAQEILQKMKGYDENQKWSRIIKEFELLPKNAKLNGEKAKEIISKIRKFANTAKKNIAISSDLKQEIDSKVKNEDYEYALQLIDKYLELNESEEYITLRENVDLLLGKQIAEEMRIAKEKQIAKEKRIADERKIAKEKQIAKEKRIAEERKIAKKIQITKQKRIAKQKEIAKEIAKQKQNKFLKKASIILIIVAVIIFTGVKINNYMTYSGYIEKAVSEIKLDKAHDYYKKALTVSGYENDEIAKVGIKEVLKQQYERYIYNAKVLTTSKEWIKADDYYKQALTVSGYENDEVALTGKERIAQEVANSAAENAIKQWKEKLAICVGSTQATDSQKFDILSKALILLNETHNSHKSHISHILKKEIFALIAKLTALKKMLCLPKQNKDWTIPEIGMDLVWVKSLNCWSGKYEVTNSEYRKYKSSHNSKGYEGHSLNGENQPVVYVNFDDAQTYARWLTNKERAAGRLPSGYKYRLPTKDEWMAIAQCGDGRKYPWGNNWPPKSGQAGNYNGRSGVGTWGKISGYNDGHAVTCDVNKSWANSWGIYGVGGNVWELTRKSASDSKFDAWRGGSWSYGFEDYLQSSYRNDYNASYRNYYYGFRLFLSR